MHLAAVLIHVKSKCLLAADPEIAAREPDPRQELVRQLLDHEQVRKAAEFLGQRLEVSRGELVANPRWRIPAAVRRKWPPPDGTLNLLQVLRLAQAGIGDGPEL